MLLHPAVIRKVRKHHIGVVIDYRAAYLAEGLAADALVDEFDYLVYLGVVVVVILRDIAAALEVVDFGGMSFMLPVPLASVPARDICSLISAAGMRASAMVTL